MENVLRTAIAVVALLAVRTVCGQSSEEMNSTNNPLTPTLAVNLQDQYVDSYYGLGDADSNAVLLRGALPQWTIDHDGEGVPKFQAFMGLNLQFPL